MSNQKVQSLWDPDQEYPPLRMPHFLTNDENIVNDMTSRADLVKRSTLSVDAKEFYPASFNITQNTASPASTKSVQDRLNKYKHMEQSVNREQDYLYETIALLTCKPGKFDSILPSLLQNLQPHFNDLEFISYITQVIFEQVRFLSEHLIKRYF